MAFLSAAAGSAYRTTIRSEAAPITPPSDDDFSAPSLPTRVVLPKKKPLKWSNGVAPGEYGGPPTTTKLRKYWGGRSDEDPVTATDDYIWNKDFLGRMQRFLSDEPQQSPNSTPSLKKQPDSGFLSLNRVMSLDSVEIDLSEELKPPTKPVLEHQVEAARRGLSAVETADVAASPRWRLAPTRREQAKWDRAAKAASGGSDVILRESRRDRGDPRVLAAQSREQYFKLKNDLQILTVCIGGTGVVSAYFSYSPEIAASFGVGLLGSLAYIRMLGNTVDSMADGAKGLIKYAPVPLNSTTISDVVIATVVGVTLFILELQWKHVVVASKFPYIRIGFKGAAGQPRLLVPVVLVMLYNRWNGTLVPNYGLMHLELIPMLVGFFTYKVATFTQAIQEAVRIVGNKD